MAKPTEHKPQTLTRRELAVAPVVVGAVAAAGSAEAQAGFAVDNASLADVLKALGEGRTSASALMRDYLARIDAYDRGGPALNAVRQLNPEAAAIAPHVAAPW